MARRVLLGFAIVLCFSPLWAYQQKQQINLLSGCLDCFNFVAPSILGAENLAAPEIGLVVYDTSYDVFRGFNADGVWQTLSNDRVLATKSTSTSIQTREDMVLADSSSGAITLTLQDAVATPGREFIVKKTSSDSNLVTIDAYSTQTIDGSDQIAIATKNGVIELVSDGTNMKVKSVSDAWRVDANITGANPSLGTSAVSSYTGITHSSLTLSNASGTNILTAKIPCASTTSPSGTTCSGADESIGVSFTVPRPGDVTACASFSSRMQLGSSGELVAAFQVVETASNSQTITQEGKSRITSGGVVTGAANERTYPNRVCGTFTFSSSGQKTLRLMYEQVVSGTITSSAIEGDANGSYGQRDIHWEVYPLE